MLLSTNISSSFVWFRSTFMNIASGCVSILRSFSFGSFDLFDIILALMIIPVGLALTIASMKGATLYAYRDSERRRRH